MLAGFGKFIACVTIDDNDGITGIIGPSGSGKSTFLRLLNRLISPTSGDIFYNGLKYGVDLSTRKIRQQIGLVQQRPYLFPGTVKDNLSYGPRIWKIHHHNNYYTNLLKKVALEESYLTRNVGSLSGGEQQRVSIARSLANKPTVLLLDEPTSSLDIVSEELIEETIIKLVKNDGIKVIIVTHSLEQTKRLSKQLLFIKDGMVETITTTEEFFKKYNEEEVKNFFRKGERINE